MNDIEKQIMSLRSLLATHVAEISALARIIEGLYEERRSQRPDMPPFRQYFSQLAERDLQAFLIQTENKNPLLASMIQELIDSARPKQDSEQEGAGDAPSARA